MSLKKNIQQHFNKAAHSYNEAAVLQKEVAHRVESRFDFLKIKPDVILDLGSGTGMGANLLYQRYPKAKIIEMDLALGMLKFSKAHKRFWQRRFGFCVATAERLPLKDRSVDIIYSNCLLQWCNDLNVVFKECFRVLKPNGLFMFSSFGPDTLIELKKSFASVDEQAHVNDFLDMHDLGDILVHSYFSDPVVDMEKIVMTYAEVADLMHDLKAMGANTVQKGSRTLTGKTKFKAMQQAYESFRNAEGVLPATFEIIYGHAFKILKSHKDEAGVVHVPIEQLEIRRS